MNSLLDPALAWFERQGWTPQAFQREVWEACVAGKSGLLQAPTGSGKTYAALAPVLSAHAAKGARNSSGLVVLWVAPLRALAKDIVQAAQTLVDGLGLAWEVGMRTGDTSARAKAQQRERLPEILVTTPESLHLLIAQRGVAQRLAGVELVVADEWHEMMGSKRGVQLALALAWMHALGPFATWGVSATVADPQLALRALLGAQRASQAVIVRAKVEKKIAVKSTMPRAFERLPWAGHIGLQLVSEVADVVAAHTSTLVFTNTRRQAEIWYQALLAERPEWAGCLAMHHG